MEPRRYPVKVRRCHQAPFPTVNFALRVDNLLFFLPFARGTTANKQTSLRLTACRSPDSELHTRRRSSLFSASQWQAKGQAGPKARRGASVHHEAFLIRTERQTRYYGSWLALIASRDASAHQCSVLTPVASSQPDLSPSIALPLSERWLCRATIGCGRCSVPGPPAQCKYHVT